MTAKKSGRGFFLTLLVISGIAIVGLYTLFFKGKEMTIFAFKWFVVNKAFVQLLPMEYTLDEAEAVRKQVYDFYERAGRNEIDDTAVMQVSKKIRRIMADEKITPDEVALLLVLIKERGPDGGGG